MFIERPTDLLARAQVWRNYKHHSTVNILIHKELFPFFHHIMVVEYQTRK